MFYHCFYLHSFLLYFTTIYHYELSAFIIVLCYCTYQNYMCTNISPCEGLVKIVIIANKDYPLEIKYFIIIVI